MKAVLGLFSYGGVEEATIDSVLVELGWASVNKKELSYQRISGDALIERSRSRALGRFMATDADCIVMVDHDIQWRPGDLCHIADVAVEQKALVGGLYCKRARGKGWASRVPISGGIQFGQPGLIETPALATGFMAIPRLVVEEVLEQLDITRPKWQESFQTALESGDNELICSLQDLSIAPIADGAYRTVDYRYHDYFRCIRAPSENSETYQFLSEDWSFANRAQFCGFKSYISTKPVLVHHGIYGYEIPDGMDDHDRLEHGQKRDTPHPPPKNKRARGNKRGVRNKSGS